MEFGSWVIEPRAPDLKVNFTGAGIATVVISFWLCSYYNVIISWAMFYLVASFEFTGHSLPWVGCNHTWNTKKCWNGQDNETTIDGESVSSAQEFYE